MFFLVILTLFLSKSMKTAQAIKITIIFLCYSSNNAGSFVTAKKTQFRTSNINNRIYCSFMVSHILKHRGINLLDYLSQIC